LVLQALDEVCARAGMRPRVLLVDDGSSEPAPADLVRREPKAIQAVDLLQLYVNLGHQRAICTGLVYLAQVGVDGRVVVMDGDGEDAPDRIPALLERYRALGEGTAVFAARGKRHEGLAFRSFYALYRMVQRVLVGHDTRIGNFSVLPMALVQRLVRSTDLWNHYAAAVMRSRQPMVTIPIDKAPRIHGTSRMNFTGLVVHGLSAVAVFGQTVSVRMLMGAVFLASAAVAGLLAVLVLKLSNALVIPGWATTAVGLLVVILLQMLLAATIFTLSLLASRTGQTWVPIRDCPTYIQGVRHLWG